MHEDVQSACLLRAHSLRGVFHEQLDNEVLSALQTTGRHRKRELVIEAEPDNIILCSVPSVAKQNSMRLEIQSASYHKRSKARQ